MATNNKNTRSVKRAAPKKQTSPKKTAHKTSDKKFPGYPKYGKEEDITTNAKRIDENLDDEVLTQVKHNQDVKAKPNSDQLTDEATQIANESSLDEQEQKPGKYDVTGEDMEALGPRDLSLDGGDDEQLKHRKRPVDFTGEDLDVPGTELDDDQEEKGTEDEENNIYSLGGDDKNNLEESQEHEGSL